MRKALCLSAAAAVALGVSGSAHAALISIGTALNGGPITLQASGATPGPVSFIGAVGGYEINDIDGTDLTSTSLNSNEQSASSKGTTDTLDIYVTVSDVTTPATAASFLSGLTVNFLSKGWTVTESTFEDNSNTVFGTATLLATNSFAPPGPDTFTKFTTVGLASPVSVTELYEVRSNGFSGSANNTIDISASVIPEPATWAMMLLGFAGFGLIGLSRRRKDLRYAF